MEALPTRIIKVRFVCDSEWARAAAALPERAPPGSAPPALVSHPFAPSHAHFIHPSIATGDTAAN